MFECNLLKTIKDTALQSNYILQVCAPTRCCQLSRIIWETPVLACKASVSVWFWSKERPRNGILGFCRARNETSTNKWKRVRSRGRKVSFLYSPPPPHSFAFAILTLKPFFAPKPHGNACYAGYSSFWTVSLVLQIRVWNLPDNHQSLLFLVDSNVSTVKF